MSENKNIIQLISVTPDELQALITKCLESLLDKLRGELSPTSENYLTRQEAAKLLRVSPLTIDNWSNAGKLKSYQLGGRIYYKLSEIDESMEPVKRKQST